jgi:YggT family protein
MVDDKLEREEAQRAANYETVKSNVESGVRGDIIANADQRTASQENYVEDVAAGMREKALGEVAQTEREIERGRAAARVSQIVDYIFMIIYAILAIRLLLELLGARESAGFVRFINTISNPFYGPFRGIVPSPSDNGFTLALPIIVAIVAYMILHLIINGLLRIVAHRKVEV